jgi:hypothetical protein
VVGRVALWWEFDICSHGTIKAIVVAASSSVKGADFSKLHHQFTPQRTMYCVQRARRLSVLSLFEFHRAHM